MVIVSLPAPPRNQLVKLFSDTPVATAQVMVSLPKPPKAVPPVVALETVLVMVSSPDPPVRAALLIA
jgi:hypothetical protein